MRSLSGKELAKLLERHAWALLRIHGSHHIYGKVGSVVRLSVPIHGNKPLRRGLQRHLLKAAGIADTNES
jgi:predicted RNA binding protein YcfA (HicA-like mRNA interferase family)